MKIFIITTVRTTTCEPYSQLPPDRIELQPTPAGMLFLPNNSELQDMYPNFWKALLTAEIHFRTDPTQLDASLLSALRNKVGVRLETDDVTQASALLNLDEKDPIFTAEHAQKTSLPRLPELPLIAIRMKSLN
jgi:hypothetical protein